MKEVDSFAASTTDRPCHALKVSRRETESIFLSYVRRLTTQSSKTSCKLKSLSADEVPEALSTSESRSLALDDSSIVSFSGRRSSRNRKGPGSAEDNVVLGAEELDKGVAVVEGDGDASTHSRFLASTIFSTLLKACFLFFHFCFPSIVDAMGRSELEFRFSVYNTLTHNTLYNCLAHAHAGS